MIFTLIGMPGCGKSCMGRVLARKLKIKNVDSDKLIVKSTGKRLIDLIDELGMDGFKALEERTLMELDVDNVILSTGGSAIYYPAVMQRLKTLGPIIYLYCNYNTLERRLGDFSQRGVVLAPGQTLRDLYAERAPLYKKYADITVDCSGNYYTQFQQRTYNVIRAYLDNIGTE